MRFEVFFPRQGFYDHIGQWIRAHSFKSVMWMPWRNSLSVTVASKPKPTGCDCGNAHFHQVAGHCDERWM